LKIGLRTITGIFYSGPYEWRLVSSFVDPAGKIKELHEGSVLDHIFYPGVSASVSENKFKVTRWGIGRIPMSGNSFVHVFVGRICREESHVSVRGYFRLNLFVFGFALFWLVGAYLLSGAVAVGAALAYFKDGDAEKLLGILFGMAFPVVGTFMLLGFRRLARSNEKEILDGLEAKLGEPIVKPA
jgi:hypothetical protein